MHAVQEDPSIAEARVPHGLGRFDVFTAMCGSVRRLSHIRRYSSFRAIWEENVAEHSFYAGFVTWILAKDLQARGFAIDAEKACVESLFGDLEEALSGDLVTIFKNSHPGLKAEAKAQGEVMADAMFTEFAHVGIWLKQAWDGSWSGDLESRAAKFADLLCVVMYAREEVRAGNDAFEPVVRDIHRDMGTMRTDDVFGVYIEQVWPHDRADDVLRQSATIHNTDRYPKHGRG